MADRIYDYIFECKVCGHVWDFCFEGLHELSDRCDKCGTMNKFKWYVDTAQQLTDLYGE